MRCDAINLRFGGHGVNIRRTAERNTQSAKAPPRKAFRRIKTLFTAKAFPPLLVAVVAPAEVVA